MSRYIIAHRKLWWDNAEQPQQPVAHPTVYDVDPIKTGIVDKDGTPIYRLPDRIGFLPSKERR